MMTDKLTVELCSIWSAVGMLCLDTTADMAPARRCFA